MYVWDTDTGNFYYGATNAIQGGFTKFALNEVSKTGGNLLIMKSISRDGGSGPDDYAAFILDTGEVIVYQGSDPGTAANWALVGRYFLPAPINKRSAIEFAGDIVVLTRQDVVSLNGGDGVVYQCDTGFDDNDSNINCVAQQAYSTLSVPNIKNVKNLTITYLFDGTSTLGAEIGYDYVDKSVSNTATSEPIGPDWDTSDWDSSSWAGASAVRNVKFSVAGSGRAISTVMQFSIRGAQFRWLGSNISLQVQKMI